MKISFILPLFLLVPVSITNALFPIDHLNTVKSLQNDYTFVECTLKQLEYKGLTNHFTHPYIPYQKGQSLNWAGYIAANDLNNPATDSVTEVSGTWTIPCLYESEHPTYSSIWVGIDGYTSGTLEQIGTEQDWINGVQSNFAWFEMYPNPPFELGGFPVNPGDSMSAGVVYIGNDIFILSMINNTQKLYTIVPISYTTFPNAQRNSAEWIVEAPYLDDIQPLAHFSKITFSDCFTNIFSIPGPISGAVWNRDHISMITPQGKVKAKPSALKWGGTSFNVTWGHE